MEIICIIEKSIGCWTGGLELHHEMKLFLSKRDDIYTEVVADCCSPERYTTLKQASGRSQNYYLNIKIAFNFGRYNVCRSNFKGFLPLEAFVK
jgi:hypothetical protein